ncbi:LacI family transcriptional regulator [Prosthecobacter fusiformis]|uniref:LacI family transcriptional regulator n=1 Tax=Prosthecobacter fusiformis TaxID=48464 RepID=A0A4R7S3D8_9BACT|nr:substrate-binding domain-containing protein [Prosthecobacter fusiformis]TDU72831.1 LacI family transcriptional regulator [Prosthecobacter fusiformis]
MSLETAPALPRRASRAAEAAAFLRERLLAGAWPRLLPGEMELARQLQVGRNTIRAALAQLEAENLLKTQSGRRREVTGTVHPPTDSPTQLAVLLLGIPYHALASSTLLWMEALRMRLAGAGWKMQVRVESAAYRRSPGHILEGLTAEQSSAVFILHRSTANMQQWFEKQGMRAVIAGTRHEGSSLPQVDTDYRAASRHAAARLAALGHRHLVILTPRAQLAGDAESIAGFREGAGEARVEVATHNDTTEGVIASLRQVITAQAAPTALFVLRAEHFATTLTWLLQQGVSIPGQMSLISRDDEPFLQHLHPEPTRYRRSAETFAKKLARLITTFGDGGPGRAPAPLLMPDFLKGGTLGPAARSPIKHAFR